MSLRYRIIERVRKTNIADKFSEMSAYQDYSREDIIIEQKRRLVNLLLFLKHKNKFYGNLLKIFSDAEIQNEPEAILSTLPISSKDFLNEHYDEIFTNDTGKSTQLKRTGGSTGTPFKFYINTESISYTWSFVLMFWNKYAGYRIGDPYATVAGNSLHSHEKKFLEYFYYFLQNNYLIKGDIITRGMKFDKKKLAKAKLIYGYPSSLNLLLEYYPDLFAESKNLKAIFTTSELLIPQVRENIERKSGRKIFDMYGANDGGIVSSECHLHSGYHYNMLSCYPESIDFHGENELVLTNFYNFNFPFVRYKVGDLGVIDKSQCECGSPFYKITGLKGRTRDLIHLKDKQVRHGSMVNSLLFRYPEIKLYKLIQQKDYSIDIKIMVQPEDRFNTVAEKLIKETEQIFNGTTIRIKKLDKVESSDKKFKIIESFVV